MSTLLAPIVIGPVSVLSTSVRIDGPLPGSSISLLVNGVPVPAVNAGATTSTFVPVAAGSLNVGDALTARWTLGAETSDPSPVPIVVLGYPSTLSPLVYLSQVHECVDWVLIGAAYPGATVEIFNGGALIGSDTARGNVVPVRIRGAIQANDVLSAVQSVQTPAGQVKSSQTPSLPAEQTPYRENTMPAPAVGPVPGCAQAVPVRGLAQGATTKVHFNGDVLEYPFVGANLLALLGRAAHNPDVFSATQHFERCNASSPSSAPPVIVDETLPVRKPVIDASQYSCPAARALPISNLEPGATLTIQLVDPTSGAATVLGRIGVGEDVSSGQYWIPDVSALIPASPPFPSLVVIQELCGKTATSDKLLVVGSYQGSVFPPTVMEPAFECASGAFVNSVDNAVVRLYSDAPDSPVISKPVFSFGGLVWVETFRPLRAGEHIHAQLELTCQPLALRVGGPIKVSDLTPLKTPDIQQPVRVFQRLIYVSGVIPGARVHVFVNGKWRASDTPLGWTTLFFGIYVGELKVEDQITVMQTLCTKMSPLTRVPVNVTLGEMLLSAAPPSLIAGQPATITIKAVDADNKSQSVGGTISQGGAVVGATNTAFTLSPPTGQASVSLQVAAVGYKTETISIPLTAAPVAKPAMLTIATGLWFNATKKEITEITWHLQGPSGSFSKTEKPNAEPALVQFALPKPAGGGFTPFTLSCEVTFQFQDFNFISGVSGTRSSDFIEGGLIKPSPSTVEMYWSGTDLTINFLVKWIQQGDYFVIELM
ncbi:hypothetical protein [Mesorhizobium sp. M0678]|uniref:hypothetical protein n=1 Tax=Mesorhizobium sp. M0678 TaxID=2956985 RepID=UPI00333CF238